MMQPSLGIRSIAIVAVLAGVVACKTRDPDSAGLLSSRPNVVDDGGFDAANANVQIACTPVPNVDGDPVNVRYIFSIAGAVSQTDEGQPVLVTVERERKGLGREPLSSYEAGRGAASRYGNIFVGFPSGVLTATYGAASMGHASHGGVMTLATDSDATAVSVNCEVVP